MATTHNYHDAFPDLNPVDILRCTITTSLVELTGVDAQVIYPALSWTNTLDKGDLLLAVPRLRLKDGPPAKKATDLANAYPQNPLLKRPEAVGVSLRFEFNPDIVASIVVPQILKLGSEFGLNRSQGLRDPSNPASGRKRVVVEFSSPNIAKKFHAGHLRSTIIGGFLSNLYEGAGWDVVRLNYLGDWGRQYGLLALGWKRYGDDIAFHADPIAHLFDIYVKISADFQPEEDAYKAAAKRGEDTSMLESQGLLGEAKAYFKRMEDGDEEALSLWRRFRALSIEKYKESYARLNISFTDYSGESQVSKDTMARVETLLQEDPICEINNNATIIDFRQHGAKNLEVAIIRNRNGTSNYLLRDIGAAVQRQEQYNMDKMIYVVMSEQETHISRLFKTLELMGGSYAEIARKSQHVTFGKVSGMSTRKGTVKFLDDILSEVAETMHDVMRRNEVKYAQVKDPKAVADALAVSAVMAQDMSGKRINNYPFDLERMTSFEGDTGPYLQYAHARLCSIARKTGFSRDDLLGADFTLLKEPHAVGLVRLMAQYPDTVNHTFKTLEPTTILTFLFRLTHQLSSSYDVLRVVGASEGEEVMLARAALYEAARQVLSNGMKLLGLSPVERM